MKKPSFVAGFTGHSQASLGEDARCLVQQPQSRRPLSAIAVLAAAAIAFATCPVFAGYSASVKQGDPLLYFQFNQTSGNLVNSANEAGAITVTATPQSASILGSATAGPKAADGLPAFENDNLAGIFSGSGSSSNVLLMGTGGNSGALLTALNGSSGVTLQMWIKPTTLPTGSNMAGLFFNPQYNGGGAIVLQLSSTGVNMLGRSQGGEASSSSGSWNYTFAPGTWYNLVAVWNYSAKTMSLYVNGAQVGSAVSAPAWLSTTYNHTNPSSFHSWLGAVSPGSYFAGAIDDFSIYKRALPATEIGAQYALSTKVDPWPFDRPSLASLRGSAKKVWAHYFTQFALQLNASEHWLTPDYYQRAYFSPYGESNKYKTRGGYLRDRPLPTPVIGGNWKLENIKNEVRTALELGIDGFTLDLLSNVGGGQWQAILDTLDAAAAVDPNFKIVLMPDMNTKGYGAPYDDDGDPSTPLIVQTDAETKQLLTNAISVLYTKSAVYREGGRLVIAPFNAHKRSAAFWQDWITSFNAAYGQNIYFVPTFQAWTTYASGYASISNGYSDWGNRNTSTGTGNDTAAWIDFSKNVHTYTNAGGQALIAMAPVAPQDFRPKETGTNNMRFWEANNSLNFRQTWSNAIREAGPAADRADWVQLITWNDYSEHSHIAPSAGIQYSFYDLSAYYNTWLKKAAAPKIERDTIFYFHRKQHGTAAYNATEQTGGAPVNGATGTPLASNVEMLAFAKDVPGNNAMTVEINLNDGSAVTTGSFTAPGTYSLTKAIPSGATARCTPSFVLKRGGVTVQAVTSNFEINNAIIYSDMMVRGGSSRRAPVESSYYARINFGSALPGNHEGSATPLYLPDLGLAYGNNSGVGAFPTTFQYGWTDTSGNPADNSANVRDRNHASSPDERYDTLVKTLNGVTRNWQISLPAGHYKVRLVAGDPNAGSGVAFKLAINGTTVINQSTTSTVKWFDVSKPFLIPAASPTLLTLTTPAGADTTYNAANFIEISSW